VVDDAELYKLENATIGAQFQLNEQRGIIVAVATVASSGLFGMPALYTTYSRAIQYIASTRFTISYIVLEPKSSDAVVHIQQQVRRLGYEALTKQVFTQKIARFYACETAYGTNLLLMTVISFVVGLSISSQVFYTSVLENLERFGALKAIGAQSSQRIAMILVQAGAIAIIGYGLGVGSSTLIMFFAHARLPTYSAILTLGNLALGFVMVLVVAAITSWVGIRRVLRIEPFDIFRG